MAKMRSRQLPLAYLSCSDFRHASEQGLIDMEPIECCEGCHVKNVISWYGENLSTDVPFGEDFEHPLVIAEVCENYPSLTDKLTRDEWAAVVCLHRREEKAAWANT